MSDRFNPAADPIADSGQEACPPGNTAGRDHARAWLGHVAAGRIGGGGSSLSDDLLAQIRRNEAVVLGATPSFPPPVRARGR